MKTYAFIDAANLFYGGKKSLGWSVDQKKLLCYLKEKYRVSNAYYFAGIDIHQFPFDYLKNDTVHVYDLEKYLYQLIKGRGNKMKGMELELLEHHYNRTRFYLKLDNFGYKLILKPVKSGMGVDGNPIRKANCDVDMAVMLMKKMHCFDRAVVLSGDGDFLPALKYLKENNKEVLILSRAPRTAKEIKQFAGEKFMDFEYLRERLKRTDLEK
jgi:uncharacterized LabA/DUF88 family protein